MFYVHRKESPSRCILCHGMICATIYLFHARWHVAYRLVTIGLVCSLFLLPVLYTKFCQSGAKFSLVHKSQMVLFLGVNITFSDEIPEGILSQLPINLQLNNKSMVHFTSVTHHSNISIHSPYETSECSLSICRATFPLYTYP